MQATPTKILHYSTPSRGGGAAIIASVSLMLATASLAGDTALWEGLLKDAAWALALAFATFLLGVLAFAFAIAAFAMRRRLIGATAMLMSIGTVTRLIIMAVHVVKSFDGHMIAC